MPVILRTEPLRGQAISAPGAQSVVPAIVIECAFPDDRGGRYSDIPEILTLGEGVTANILNSGRENDFLQIVACGERAESDMSDGRGKDKSPKPGQPEAMGGNRLQSFRKVDFLKLQVFELVAADGPCALRDKQYTHLIYDLP